MEDFDGSSLELPRDAVLHSTRHTMRTELGIAGADASTIQVIAGHEDIRTSQRYLHPTPEHVLMAFQRMHAMRGDLAIRKPVSGRKTACHGSASLCARFSSSTDRRTEQRHIFNVSVVPGTGLEPARLLGTWS
jgi:hypothetical protein